MGPIGISQQFQTQHKNPFKVVYVKGGDGLGALSFRSPPELDEAFSNLNIRICPESLISFQTFSMAT